MDEFLVRSKRLEKTKMNRMFVFGIFRPMVYMLFVTSNLFLFYIGCKGYIKDTTFLGQTITSETVVAFYMYISRFFNPIQTLAEQFDMLEQSFAAAEKIFTILDMEPEVVDEPDAIELGDIKGEIEFRDVWFAYNPGEWVLKGVSFHVYPKQTVAFVGSTGSGKSTILSLICRNYDIQKGQILIDGVDYRQRSQLWLHSSIGYVLQDPHLFSGTVRENIRYGKLDATDAQVEAAARAVSADTVVAKLEKGWDSDVGEGGGRLSTGEKQLISFARAVLADPRIFVLDEATSSIDTQTEQLIQQAIDHLLQDRTSFLIAHRLSTIRKADMILVVRDGRIVEQGTHQELLRRHGYYHDLYSKQFAEESAARILQ